MGSIAALCGGDERTITDADERYSADLAAFRESSFVGEYVIYTEGFDGQARVRMYKDQMSRLRFDMINEHYPTVTVFYPHGLQSDDELTVCSEDLSEVFAEPPSAPAGACSDAPTADLAWTLIFTPFVAYALPIANELSVLSAEATRVAGRPANCYEVDADEFGSTCFGDGVLLSVATSNYDWRAELTSTRELDVVEDFRPPYPLVPG